MNVEDKQMEYLEIIEHINPKTRDCLMRRYTKGGEPYFYRPRSDLLLRLSRETGEDVESVLNMLFKLRDFYLRTQSPTK